MSGKNPVRLGIIGLGMMGATHARNVIDRKISRVKLSAVCNSRPPGFPCDARFFARSDELIRSGEVDAVLIATPHPSHAEIGIDALEHGLHVLIEKPLAVHKAEAERLVAAHRGEAQMFAAMFNQRTDPFFQKIRELVRGGELGEIRRVQWTITNWFRTDAYYRSSDWRATWAGEGGGVLINQCLHNLDLWQWIFGMPARVRAFCRLGRHHDIEVEDEVTAYLEDDRGATGVLITSTGEAPGTNRLEIAGEMGRLIYENDRLTFSRNEIAASQWSRTHANGFTPPAVSEIAFPLEGHGGQHVEVVQNFVDAILDGTPLIAPAAEGIRSIELANAMVLSSLEKKTIEFPLDAQRYETKLRELIAQSPLSAAATSG